MMKTTLRSVAAGISLAAILGACATEAVSPAASQSAMQEAWDELTDQDREDICTGVDLFGADTLVEMAGDSKPEWLDADDAAAFLEDQC